MTLLHRLVSIFSWIFRRSRAEQQLDDELRAFLEMSAAEKVQEGMTPAEAHRRAVLELGGLEQAKERVRTARHGGLLDEIGRDVRYACRTSLRNPGFTAVVVLTLGLGIGANTAIFGLIDALMLRWLPVRNPGELVQLALQSRGAESPGDSLSYPIVRAVAERREIFSGVAGFSGFSVDVGAPGAVTRVPGALVTGGFYETLGLQPAAGRLLSRDDDEPGAPLVAVIGYGYWQRQFGGAADVIGKILRINGIPVTVVGVSPEGFTGANVGQVADITMPVAALPLLSPSAAGLLGPGNFWLRVLARPRPGMSMEEATARLNAAWPQFVDSVIATHWPADRQKSIFRDAVFHLSPGGTGWTYLREIYRKPLLVLMAVVGVVLVIACANVASLLLARAFTRQREIAVRLAVGAGRGRIVRQLLIESALLSLAGAALGLGIAWAGAELLVGIIESETGQIVFDLTPNQTVLGFTLATAVATVFLFGLAPALQATAEGPGAALKGDTRMSRARSRLLPALITGQIALSLALLAAAGLFVRTLQNLQTLDPGFSAEGVLLADLEGRRTAVAEALLEEVRRLPGVVSASLSTHTPLSGASWSEPAVPAGQELPSRDNALFIGATPGFFETMQIDLIAGRTFTGGDTRGGSPVAIVNEAFANKHFPGANPVGRQLLASVRGERSLLEIVGLVRNTRTAGLREEPPPTVYVAYDQLTGDRPTTLSVRAAGSLGRVSADLQQVLRSRLPETSVEVRPLSAQVEATIVRERMLATLGSGFGLLALTLACIGLYGLLAYGVAQRSKEIGIRMALGAHGRRVVGLVLGGAARLVAAGVLAGLPAAWAASAWVESMLFGLTPGDPAVLGGSIAVLTAAALIASYLPARRASHVNPLVVLRHE